MVENKCTTFSFELHRTHPSAIKKDYFCQKFTTRVAPEIISGWPILITFYLIDISSRRGPQEALYNS